MNVLTELQLQQSLATLPDWQVEQGELVRSLKFEDFRAAMTFVDQIAALSERMNHHPDIEIRYNKVRLALVTHDAGGITENDISLAKRVSALV